MEFIARSKRLPYGYVTRPLITGQVHSLSPMSHRKVRAEIGNHLEDDREPPSAVPSKRGPALIDCKSSAERMEHLRPKAQGCSG